MTEISVGFTIVIPGSLDPDMHFGLEVKWLRRYFSLSFYLINLKFRQNIPRVVRRGAMAFLRHPSCSSGLIQDFLDYCTLEWQKAVSAYLKSEQIPHYAALQMQKAVSAYL